MQGEFEDAYRRVSAEAVERVTGGRPRELEVRVNLGGHGHFCLAMDSSPGDSVRRLNDYFGTTGSDLRPGSRLRGIYLQGEISQTGQPVRLVRMSENEFHVLPLDLPKPPSWPRRVDDD